jgi:hypothetical protein
MTENAAQQPDPRWPGRTAEEAAVLESIARSAGRKWAEGNVDLILAQAQAAADAAWIPWLKKVWRGVLVLAVVISAAVVILWYLSTESPISEPPIGRPSAANFGRLKEGMTLEEVTNILGPPGDYRTANTTWEDALGRFQGFPAHRFPSMTRNTKSVVWYTDHGNVQVYFISSGRTAMGIYEPMRIRNDTTSSK